MRLLFLVIFSVSLFSIRSQELLDSAALSAAYEYNDIDEALKDPDNVVKLVLRKKKFKAFPSQLYRFKNLQYLDLSRNNISELPDSVSQLSGLQVLIISKNGLERLPNTIGALKNLRQLNVNQNEIERLPYSIGQLDKLEVADLWSNNLEYFPESMKEMKSLKLLDLRNILIPQEHQDRIQSMLPNTKIYFSPPCRCSW